MKSLRLSVLRATAVLLLVAGAGRLTGAESPRLAIHQTDDARFPAPLVAEGITRGEAWVLISVGADGKLADALVTRHTHRAFANEALRALRTWRYDPVLVHGRAVAVCTEVHFNFEASGTVVTLDPFITMQRLTAFGTRPDYYSHLCTSDEIDQTPTPVHRVSPLHPGQAPGATAAGGKATIEFIIDETGTPRMPILISAPDPVFGESVAEALTQWKFTPPTRKGKPVAVWVRQDFVFPGVP